MSGGLKVVVIALVLYELFLKPKPKPDTSLDFNANLQPDFNHNLQATP